MKNSAKVFAMILSLAFILGLASCKETDENKGNQSSQTVSAGAETEVPFFCDADSAKAALKSASYDSETWKMPFSNSSSAYAFFGGILLRYNVSKNTIDMALNAKKLADQGRGTVVTFTPDGKFAIIFNRFAQSGDDSSDKRVYIIDISKKTVEILVNTESELSEETVPEKYKSDFDPTIREFNKPEKSVLDYTIESEPEGTEIVFKAYKINDSSKSYVVSALSTMGVGNFTGVGKAKIVALLPTEAPFEMGYFKFALIDVTKDKILNELILNKK